MTQLTADDLLLASDDPGGSPASRKITRANAGKTLIEPTSKVANYNFASSDEMIKFNAAGGVLNGNLPTAIGIQGKTYFPIKVDSTSNPISLIPSGAETINGASEYNIVEQWECPAVTSDGTGWLARL